MFPLSTARGVCLMIRLTDEEMDTVWNEASSLKLLMGSAEDIKQSGINCARALRDAQLKKVAEWGNETCYEHLKVMGGLPIFRHRCDMCWQAILEEVK